MNDPHRPRGRFPAHTIALAALGGVAVLLAYALYDPPAARRAALPERAGAAEVSRDDLDDSWATRAQQKALGTAPGRLNSRPSEAAVSDEPFASRSVGELGFVERPATRTVTHVGVAPRRAVPETSRRSQPNAPSPYSELSLADLPPPGD